MKDFASIYEKINLDRNECVLMINLARQQKLTLNEKVRLQATEVSILASGVSHKLTQLKAIDAELTKLAAKRVQIKTDTSKEVSKKILYSLICLYTS